MLVPFIQSPIGLVPKAGGQTRLIFHLSYNFDEETMRSVNHYTPPKLYMVHYHDLDMAVRNSLQLLEMIGDQGIIWYSKTDLKSAFRILGLSPKVWWVLVFKATNPENGELCFFVDKCLPFGASISCSHFQRFSDALAHIWRYLMQSKFPFPPSVTNYLDNLLFVERSEQICNQLMQGFLDMCRILSVPVVHW